MEVALDVSLCIQWNQFFYVDLDPGPCFFGVVRLWQVVCQHQQQVEGSCISGPEVIFSLDSVDVECVGFSYGCADRDQGFSFVDSFVVLGEGFDGYWVRAVLIGVGHFLQGYPH